MAQYVLFEFTDQAGAKSQAVLEDLGTGGVFWTLDGELFEVPSGSNTILDLEYPTPEWAHDA